jgi:hypothetical protein
MATMTRSSIEQASDAPVVVVDASAVLLAATAMADPPDPLLTVIAIYVTA